MTFGVRTEVVSFCTKLNISNVFQAHYVTVTGAAYDDFLKLAHIVEQSVVFDIDFVDCTLDSTDWRHEVLLVDGADDFSWCYAIHSQNVRFYPDTHTVFVTDKLCTSHASDTANLWYYIDIQEVDDELLIKLIIGALQT